MGPNYNPFVFLDRFHNATLDFDNPIYQNEEIWRSFEEHIQIAIEEKMYRFLRLFSNAIQTYRQIFSISLVVSALELKPWTENEEAEYNARAEKVRQRINSIIKLCDDAFVASLTDEELSNMTPANPRRILLTLLNQEIKEGRGAPYSHTQEDLRKATALPLNMLRRHLHWLEIHQMMMPWRGRDDEIIITEKGVAALQRLDVAA